MMSGKIEVFRLMGLSKANEEILVDLVKNKERLMAHIDEICKGFSHKEMSSMISRFCKLKDEGYIMLMLADNRIYNVQLTIDGEDYIEENELLIEEFVKETLLDIIKKVGSRHGNIYPSIWGIKGGSESIEWRQCDEQEWEVRIGVVADIPEVKQIGREIIQAMEQHNYIAISIDDDDRKPRFEQTIRFVHKSNNQLVKSIPDTTDFYFDTFFKDFTNSCIDMQSYKLISDIKVSEDNKTQYIWRSLKDKGYDVQDQTQRGSSATGKQSGEVDLLINGSEKMPVAMIEALKLSSIDSAEIKLHIDKMTNYDTAGLSTNILLVYTYTCDFGGFIERYIKHIIEKAKLKYPLSNLIDVSTDEYSEFRVLTSTYARSDKERKLLHVFVNLPLG